MNENLSNQRSDSNASWARIETGIEACFSRDRTAIELHTNDAEKTLVKVFKSDTEKEIFIEKTEAEKFIKMIIFLGRKEEVRSESGWTKFVRVRVEWRNLNFVEESSGTISALSNEWTIEEMEEYLPNIKDAAIVKKVKETLARGLHRRALEINSETKKFIERILSREESL